MTAQWLVIGRIGTPFGVRGWVKVHSDTDPSAQIFHYQPWRVKRHDEQFLVVIEDFKVHGRGYIVKLAGYEQPETVALLTNSVICIQREQLQTLPPNEYYWEELVDYDVVNQQQIHLGRVAYLFNNGAHDIIVVRGNKEYWIPFVMGHYICHVDKAMHSIEVDWHHDDTTT